MVQFFYFVTLNFGCCSIVLPNFTLPSNPSIGKKTRLCDNNRSPNLFRCSLANIKRITAPYGISIHILKLETFWFNIKSNNSRIWRILSHSVYDVGFCLKFCMQILMGNISKCESKLLQTEQQSDLNIVKKPKWSSGNSKWMSGFTQNKAFAKEIFM